MNLFKAFGVYILLWALVFFGTAVPANDCAATLGFEAPNNSQIDSFRKELLVNYANYYLSAGTKRYMALVLQRVGPEVKYLDREILRDQTGHVFNLGGLTDTLRMVYTFPLASHYHIIDVMSDGYALVSEFILRLKHLAPGAKVRIISRGFLSAYKVERSKYVKRSDVERNLFQQMRVDANAREPLVVEVTLTTSSLGNQKKVFYLHPIDIEIEAETREVMASVPPEEEIVGIFREDAGPRLGSKSWEVTLAPLFQRIRKGGIYVVQSGGASDLETDLGSDFQRIPEYNLGPDRPITQVLFYQQSAHELSKRIPLMSVKIGENYFTSVERIKFPSPFEFIEASQTELNDALHRTYDQGGSYFLFRKID